MALNLHITPDKPDWDMVRADNWNIWQKLAAASKGWLTPANCMSCLGAVLVAIGLLQLKNDVTASGVALILGGRLADVADGFIADKTGTKSPLGELVDTSADKFVAALTLAALYIYGLLPVVVLAAIALHTVVNSTVSLIGRSRRTIIHPSLEGKLATFSAWAVIISYLIYLLLDARIVLLLSLLLFAGFILLAVRSTYAYISQIVHS